MRQRGGGGGATSCRRGRALDAGWAPSALADAPGAAGLPRDELSFIMVKPDGVHRCALCSCVARWVCTVQLAAVQLACTLTSQAVQC